MIAHAAIIKWIMLMGKVLNGGNCFVAFILDLELKD